MYRKLFFYLSLVIIISCQKKYIYFARQDALSYRFDEKVKATDSSVVSLIMPYKSVLDVKMNEVIGFNQEEMTKARPSSPLTNFVADAILEGYETMSGNQIDFVIQNFGGIRINSLGPGDITVGEVFEIMPFENALLILEVDGPTTMKIFNKLARSSGWPISIGTGFIIRDSMPSDILIDSRAFDLNKTYKIGMPDYVANGGDDFYFLKNLPRQETGLMIRDILLKYIRTKHNIKSIDDNRIKIENK